MQEIDISALAVVIAAIASFLIGGFWYSPSVFGEAWKKYLGKKDHELKSSKVMIITPMVTGLITAYVLAQLTQYLEITTLTGAVKTGLWLWFGIIMPVMLVNTVFNRQKLGLFLINAGYQAVIIATMTIILALW